MGAIGTTLSGHYLSFISGGNLTAVTIAPSGNLGIGTISPARLLHVNDQARIGSIPLEAGTAQICFNAEGDLLQCGASSLRLKTNVKPMDIGLDIVRRLRPISFNWKEDGYPNIGLGRKMSQPLRHHSYSLTATAKPQVISTSA